METLRRVRGSVLALVGIGLITLSARPLHAASAAEIDRNAGAALNKLYASQPTAKMLSQKAKGILVFPTMVKAGFMFGGQLGEGALRKQGKTAGYYNSVAASYGFQAGVQSFGYALFFMSDASTSSTQPVGSRSASVRVSSSSTRASGDRSRAIQSPAMSTPSSSTRRV